jgi:hypothetical protein
MSRAGEFGEKLGGKRQNRRRKSALMKSAPGWAPKVLLIGVAGALIWFSVSYWLKHDDSQKRQAQRDAQNVAAAIQRAVQRYEGMPAAQRPPLDTTQLEPLVRQLKAAGLADTVEATYVLEHLSQFVLVHDGGRPVVKAK